MTVEPNPLEVLLKQARLAIPRLERLAPDSPFAHQASGCRRTLLQYSTRLSGGLPGESRLLSPRETASFRRALEQAFAILEAAAHDKTDHLHFEEGG